MPKHVVVIPARYQSTRFPGKPLVGLLGRPMILWTAALSASAVGINNTYVATDDGRIADVVREAGFNVVMTSSSAPTGTDRVAEAAQQIKSDIYISVQGDEPLLNPKDILGVLEEKVSNPGDVVNGYCCMGTEEDPSSTNIPKVVFTEDKRLIYMSRLPVPGSKQWKEHTDYYKQVCVYAFNYDQLLRYQEFGRRGIAEKYEDIEILRFLELGETVRMVQTSPGSVAVDVPEDVLLAEQKMKIQHGGDT